MDSIASGVQSKLPALMLCVVHPACCALPKWHCEAGIIVKILVPWYVAAVGQEEGIGRRP